MELSASNRTVIMNILKTCSTLTSVIFLTQCSSSGRVVHEKSNGEFQADHGPFDSRGNYIESWADNPPKRSYKSSRTTSKKTTKPSNSSSSSYKPKSTYTPAPKPTVKPKPTTTYAPKTTYKPKPKPKVTVKPKPKPKKITPKTKPPIIHVVRKGDTVYGVARKYSANPSAIIKANNIKGGLIRLGQRLIVPRK